MPKTEMVFRCAAWTGETRCNHEAVDASSYMLPEFLNLCIFHLQEIDDFIGLKCEQKRIEAARQTANSSGKIHRVPVPKRKGQKGDFERAAFVYFMQRADGRIKIGYSTNVSRRRKNIESAAGPVSLLAVVPGGPLEESALHMKFHGFRVHGEWFDPDETLLAYISELNDHLL